MNSRNRISEGGGGDAPDGLRAPPWHLLIILLLAGVFTACERDTPVTDESAAGERVLPVFTEAARSARVDFEHVASEGKFYIVEEMGPGGALFDADGDGDPDLYLVQGGRIYGTDRGEKLPNRFYRNLGDGTFRDDTETSGAGDTGYALGCAAADVDNDGDQDLLVTNAGPDVLFLNDGEGRFTDVSDRSGVGDAGLSTSAAFFDYDQDGRLDLFIAVYLPWTVDLEVPCYDRRGRRDYCHPSEYPPGQDRLFRNRGDGTFQDVTDAAGLGGRPAYGLGVVACDFDRDGHADLYVANDSQPNHLWLNNGDGTFRETAMEMGCAYNAEGNPEASMGIVCEDFDADGDFDLLLTHLGQETNTFYRNEGDHFVDATRALGLGAIGLPETGFGAGLADPDNDGRPELFVANGAVSRRSTPQRPGHDYAERNLLLTPGADGVFQDITAAAGPGLEPVEMSRGAIFGDYDNDGDVDIIVTNNRGPAHLLRNDTRSNNHWISIDAEGVTCNRDAIGAIVTMRRGDVVRTRQLSPSYSYCSSNDRRVHFGLGRSSRPVTVDVGWPDGSAERWSDLQPDRVHRLVQGEGAGIDVQVLASGESEPRRRAGPAESAAEAATEPQVPALDESQFAALTSRIQRLTSEARYCEAIPVAEQWVEESRNIAGYDHPMLMRATVTLARLHQACGDAPQAETVLLDAIARYEQQADEHHPGIGRFASELASLYRQQGRTRDAELRLEQVVAISERTFGRDSDQRMLALRQLADFYLAEGRADAATSALQRALDAARNADDPRQRFDTLRALAAVSQQKRQWLEAARYESEAAAIADDRLDSLSAAEAHLEAGNAFRQLRDFARAAGHFQQAMENRVAVNGREDLETVTAMSQYGAALSDLGRLDEAERLMREADGTFERLAGPDHLYTATNLRNLAAVLVNRKAFSEAELLFARALTVYERDLGPDHTATREVRDNLRKVRQAQQ